LCLPLVVFYLKTRKNNYGKLRESNEKNEMGHFFSFSFKLNDGKNWKWNSAPDAWEPGDYRGPTCATCHMSGIGTLKTTHNVTERLYWNLWAKESKVRNSRDIMSVRYGNGIEGRKKMKRVCSSCHSSLHTNNFFKQGDKAVKLYNVAYYPPAKKMLDTLRKRKLLLKNPWKDPFQITFYYLWHHEGRRARHGAMMGSADYAHWHGFFELQIDLNKLQVMYKQRMKTGKISGAVSH
jgi:hydroxylamine dehydrogenase